MMRSHWRQALAGLACSLPLALAAAEGFDYSYRLMSGGLPLAQVFDDGRKTYLVPARNADPKTLEAIGKSLVVSRGGDEQPASLEKSSPNLTIAGVYDRISIAVGPRRAVAIYTGQRVAAPAPAPETPKAETPAAAPGKAAASTPVPGKVGASAPTPTAPASAAAAAPALEKRVEIPENPGVARVVAASHAPMPGSREARLEASRRPDEPEIADYKVLVPFVYGKAALGKEGEKAVQEIATMGQIAQSILIRVPGDLGGGRQIAHGRAAEIYRLLAKAGLALQHVAIEVVDAASGGKLAMAEVTLRIELGGER